MAWLDDDGVVHTMWIYEPTSIVGPVLASAIEGASEGDILEATETIARMTGEVLEGVAPSLRAQTGVACEPGNSNASEVEPDDLKVDIVGDGRSLAQQIEEAIKSFDPTWRVEVMFAINDVLHDRRELLQKR